MAQVTRLPAGYPQVTRRMAKATRRFPRIDGKFRSTENARQLRGAAGYTGGPSHVQLSRRYKTNTQKPCAQTQSQRKQNTPQNSKKRGGAPRSERGGPGSSRGPSDLQSDALPTELRSAARRGAAWRGVARRGAAWRGAARRGAAWRGAAWRGVARRAQGCLAIDIFDRAHPIKKNDRRSVFVDRNYSSLISACFWEKPVQQNVSVCMLVCV
jgi:hypothetical protein